MVRGMIGTRGPGGLTFPLPAANGLRSAFAVAGFPATHSADQSGSPPVTGTVPGDRRCLIGPDVPGVDHVVEPGNDVPQIVRRGNAVVVEVTGTAQQSEGG